MENQSDQLEGRSDWDGVDLSHLPPRLRRYLLSTSPGRVQGVFHYPIAHAILGESRPVYVVSHYASTRGTQVDRLRWALLVHQNSHLVSFADDLATFAVLAQAGMPGASARLADLAGGLARRYLAERLLAERSCHIGRTLFLEALIAYEPRFRRLYTQAGDLRTRSRAVTRLTADLHLHHELGHVAEADTRYDKLITPEIDGYLERVADFRPPDVEQFRKEARADLFALWSALTLAGERHGAEVAKSLVRFAVRATVAFGVLGAAARDLYRVNVDPSLSVDVQAAFDGWAHREGLMLGALDAFDYGDETVPARAGDPGLPLVVPDEVWLSLVNLDALIAPIDEDSRRLAEVISRGFPDCPAEVSGFDNVLAAARTSWVLGPEG